jgi:hypothetical protein
MSTIDRSYFKKADVTITSGTDYSTAIDFRGASVGALVAAAGFGNASVTIEWNGNSKTDKPTDSDTWYALKSSTNSAISAATVQAATADYVEVPATAHGKPWIRIKLGGNAAATKTISVYAAG